MKYRRRNYIANPGLQIRFTLLFVFISLLGSIVSIVAFNFFALKELEALKWSTHLNVNATGDILKPLFIYVNIANFLFVSVLLITTWVWMTKKVSMPIYKMSKDIMSVANYDLSTTIALRQKDEFKDTARSLNVMVKSIREKFKIIMEKHIIVSDSLVAFIHETNNKETDTKNYRAIMQHIEDLESEIKGFQVKERQKQAENLKQIY